MWNGKDIQCSQQSSVIALLHAQVGLDDPRVRIAQTPIRTSPTHLNWSRLVLTPKSDSWSRGSRGKKFGVFMVVPVEGCLHQVLHFSGKAYSQHADRFFFIKEKPFLWNVKHSDNKNRTIEMHDINRMRGNSQYWNSSYFCRRN